MQVDKRTNTWVLQVLIPASAILVLDKDASGVWFVLLCEKAPAYSCIFWKSLYKEQTKI